MSSRPAIGLDEVGQRSDAEEVLVDCHVLLGGVADADVTGCEIYRRYAARGEERRFRPERRTLDHAAVGTATLDGRLEEPDRRVAGGGVEILAGPELADQAELAAAGDGNQPAALDRCDEEEGTADQRVAAAL